MMTKREKFEQLDTLVLDAMIELVSAKNYEAIKDLGSTVTYLKNNQVITPPKEEDGIGDTIKGILDK